MKNIQPNTSNTGEAFVADIPFTPNLRPRDQKEFLKFAIRLRKELTRNNHLDKVEIVDLFRRQAFEEINEGEPTEMSFAKSILLDLVAQDWRIKYENQGIRLNAPSLSQGSPTEIKDRTRRGHLVERNSKINEPNVAGFIKSMESKRLTSKGWHSIFSLMRDGKELADQLSSINKISEVIDRLQKLRTCISPYIQFIDSESICDHTGLKLSDVWRYFRLTWVSVHKSVPGRSMMILIRDGASPNHPVIGIAALGSSVVQQTIRDKWIGWDSDQFVTDYIQTPTVKVTKWFKKVLDDAIDDLYIKDLLEEKIVTRVAVKKPDSRTISKLRRDASKYINRHRLFPKKASQQSDLKTDKECEVRAKSYLFRSKRSNVLATLLSVKAILLDSNFYNKYDKPILNNNKVKTALKHLVRVAKGQHVGINMMDITVCGALAPYNAILGGKLVCMLLTSPQVVDAYAKRYSKQVSVIASSMKGKRVLRKPKLALLCTTSLYGVGSSQYNRIKIPAKLLGGLADQLIEYKELGLSLGYGSFHISSDTISLANTLLAQKRKFRKVNSIFGEGVNPLMRKFRDAVQIIGLPGIQILHHGNKRIVYGISLCTNLREILLGIESRPKYILPLEHSAQVTENLIDFWMERWLNNRINNDEVILKVRQNSLSHPISHQAKAPMLADVPSRIELNFQSFSQTS